MSYLRGKTLSTKPLSTKTSSSSSSSSVPCTLDKEVTLPSDAEDTISSVSWSPTSHHLAAASWDGNVRVYNVSPTGVARGVALLAAGGPILDCDWAKDGSTVAAGGADKTVHLLNMSTNQQATLGNHEAPIRSVRFVDVPECNEPIVATGSWDKTVKYWDLRQQDPLGTITCNERVYSMDSKAHVLVVANAARQVHIFDLKNPGVIYRTIESPLKYQTKVVAAFPDGKGFGIASIEGRCAMNAVEDKDETSINFTFRCHRETEGKVEKVYSVNDMSFHPITHSVFSTGGSDGVFQFWDRVTHTKFRHYQKADEAITATAFNRDGSFLAYAIGYDWSRGCAANTQKTETKLMLHPVDEEDLKKKA
ncbi:WD repeat domain-containing protein [Annulohypoxylon truncatum]|uniref:WD repeat domain-containing protein n=1 Tax=Annulohypoxylon truncatum TaxID=327061 RepID=UPI002008096D|nr:WD repeat domain-containing protein [Annulohypoxylon truncatum]KAI1212175.1 WD repeat domain-containing protein [Annulohypoxylon truncatum]